MNKITSFLKKAFWFSAAVIIVSCAGITYFSTSTVSANVPDMIDTSPAKMEALKADLVTRLSQCESAGHSEAYGLVTFDQNKAGTLSARNTPSFGILQFKVTTVQKYAKDRDGKDISGKDAILLALDAQQAEALASYIIFQTDGGWTNWENCMNKLDLVPEIKVIKELAAK